MKEDCRGHGGKYETHKTIRRRSFNLLRAPVYRLRNRKTFLCELHRSGLLCGIFLRNYVGLYQHDDMGRREMKTNGERQKKWRAKPENRVKEQARDRMRKSDPKVKARNKLQALNSKGKVEKEPCIICGARDNIECHHPDHTKPLNFICLCASCHRKLHKEFRDEMRAKNP